METPNAHELDEMMEQRQSRYVVFDVAEAIKDATGLDQDDDAVQAVLYALTRASVFEAVLQQAKRWGAAVRGKEYVNDAG